MPDKHTATEASVDLQSIVVGFFSSKIASSRAKKFILSIPKYGRASELAENSATRDPSCACQSIFSRLIAQVLPVNGRELGSSGTRNLLEPD